ncbi:MAG: hypothetical protein Q9227_002132 [Pyrenula ochraceoflavens]
MTEAQKYEGAHNRSKSNKSANRKSVSIAEPDRDSKALVPRAAYVEDDPDDPSAPPAAPSPPPAVPAIASQPVNVFDFLVPDETPNASTASLGGSKEQMSMKHNAPSVFSDSGNKRLTKDSHEVEASDDLVDFAYEEDGYTYGSHPIKPSSHPLKPKDPNASLASLEFMTPYNKHSKDDRPNHRPSHNRTDSGTIGKRKRHVEDLDISRANSVSSSIHYDQEADTLMTDAPSTAPALAHSGLTGSLNRLLSNSEFPPSPDYSDEKERTQSSHQPRDPASPLKRTRHARDTSRTTAGRSNSHRDTNGLGLSLKGRAGRVLSMISAGGTSQPIALTNPNKETAVTKTRRRASSSEDGQVYHDRSEQRHERRPRKHHKVHGGRHTTTALVPHSSSRSRRRSSHPIEVEEPRSRKLKAIEYHRKSDNEESEDSDSDNNRNNQNVVVYGMEERQRKRAENFLNYVKKGPASERGCSMNKALKRWKRDIPGRREEKEDEEKELWRSLRLKRNERGEIVVFF